MVAINEGFLNLKDSYLFSDISKRVAAYQKEHPDKKIIRLGIGDVTLPLSPSVIEAMHEAVSEMGNAETFHGYGPEIGYEFLREKIAAYYKNRGVTLGLDEIIISDGAKSDVANITDLFDKDNTVLIPDPVYPVYMDTNVMNERNIVFIDANESNGFLPLPDDSIDASMIYLCSPNNPSGAVYNKEQLKQWVDYALEKKAVILFDAAYEAYISDDSLPHSIFEIEGAKRCAIEFCSFSKTAGFTGTRLAFTVISHELVVETSKGEVELNRLWVRRQSTKFNGVPYVIQKAGAAVFTEKGFKEAKGLIDYYMQNAQTIAKALDQKGIKYFGGINSPYVWMKCPDGMDSWTFFDALLSRCNVVGTPGAGFGKNGEGYFRLTSFGSHENTEEAVKRFLEQF